MQTETIETIMDRLIFQAPDGKPNIPKSPMVHPLIGRRCQSNSGGHWKQGRVVEVREGEGMVVKFPSGTTSLVPTDRWNKFWVVIG